MEYGEDEKSAEKRRRTERKGDWKGMKGARSKKLRWIVGEGEVVLGRKGGALREKVRWIGGESEVDWG